MNAKSSTGILLSTLLVTSLLAVLSMHAASSETIGTPEAPAIPKILSASDPVKEITPTADVSVQEGGDSGRDDRIAARSWSAGSYNIRSFLKFDISCIVPGSTITSATLHLQCYTITNYYVGQGLDVEIRGVADNTWDEATMIWSTQPAMGSVQSYFYLDNENLPGYNPMVKWYENDITSYVQDEYSNGHTLVSLGLRCITENYPGDANYHGFYCYDKDTTEYVIGPENYPRLVITYTPPDIYAVDVSILPDSKEGLQGSTQSFTVNVYNSGGYTENVLLDKGDNTDWVLTLDNSRFDNIPSGETRTTTLTVKIPDDAPIGTQDKVWVNGTVMENTSAVDNASCVVTCTDSISTSADASVAELQPNVNQDNTYNRLQSWTLPTWGNDRIFIKFPLDGIPSGKNIESAKLMLYCWSADGDDMDAQVCRVDDDSWDEKLITWNNKPPIGDVLDTQTLSGWPYESSNRGVENSWISWEVRDFVTGQRYYSDNIASFCIKAEVENTSGVYMFEGRSWSGLTVRPKLVITFGAVENAVSISISPVHRIGDNGVTENFTVTVMNKGNVIDNYTLENTDNATWSKTLTPSRFDNVKPGESKTATLSVTIPGDATPGAVNNVKVTVTGTGVSDNENCSVSVKNVNSWVVAGYSPRIDNYGVAVTNAGNYIYVANSNTLGTRVNFMRYDPTVGGQWTYLATPSIATPFKNGTALAWDKGNYIYALCGGSYNDVAPDNARHYFWRYHIDNNWWESLENTGGSAKGWGDNVGAQGAGDALAVDTNNHYVYAIVGQRYMGSTFWRYNIASGHWENLNLSTSGWSNTDDGCSLVWTGGDYLYAFQGQTSTINENFYRYSISGNSWTKMADAPAGVDDGGSLLWLGGDNIYALLGGDPSENLRDNCFYVYNIRGNNWTKLENLPSGIMDPTGQRLGFIEKGIYCWRGTRSDPVLWVYTLPTLVEQFSLHLVAGWNLIGFQITNANMTPDNLFAGTALKVSYYTAPYGPYGEAPSTSPIEDNRGYWVKENQDITITFSGVRQPSRTLYFVTGWNLMSFPLTSASTTPDNIFAGTALKVSYYTAPYGPYGEAPSTSPIEDNRGYWVKENQNYSVTIPI